MADTRRIYRNRNSGAMRISSSAMSPYFELLEGDEAADALAEHDEIVSAKRDAAIEARRSSRSSSTSSTSSKPKRGKRKADTEPD
jgi:hypothetical protein